MLCSLICTAATKVKESTCAAGCYYAGWRGNAPRKCVGSWLAAEYYKEEVDGKKKKRKKKTHSIIVREEILNHI